MKTLHTLLIAAALATSLASNQAEASEPLQYDLIADLKIQAAYVDDVGYDAVSDNDVLNTLHLGVGYGLDALLPGLRTYFIFETALSGDPASRFNGQVDLQWNQNYFMLAADYGPTLWGWFRPFARLGAGYALQSLTVTKDGELDTLHDYAHDLAYTGSLGLEALWLVGKPDAGNLTLAFTGQLGYRGQTGAEFDELAYENPPDDGFPREEINLGVLDTSAVFWDLGVGVRFDF